MNEGAKMAMGGIGGGTPSPRPGIRSGGAFQELAEISADLSSALDQLESHLNPVLSAPHPTAAEDSTKAESPIDDLAIRMSNHRSRITGLIQRLRL